ncbi:response regulator [Maribacter sp. 2210JD10-5]|uniref:response regulator n=1 Tax=Maribacter sp. 2210JD10-5 TaxID=3386272 RepID=UPI0039BCE068
MTKYNSIYLVDDHDIMNHLHNIILKNLDLQERTKTFSNPEKALEDLRLHKNDGQLTLVLLDLNMPEMSGFDFLDILTEENFPNTIDVVILTSSISHFDKEESEKYPKFVKDFVTKPLNFDSLKPLTEYITKAI